MSDNLPLEIMFEIIKRLPVKSLIQFRSVSKAWKSLIDSSDFIADYSAQHTQLQHILVNCYDTDGQNFVSIAEDDTFPQQRVFVTNPGLVKWLGEDYDIIDCSNGLLCLYGVCGKGRGGHNSVTCMAVLWNLSIRKAVAVIVPNVRNGTYGTLVGFGVCCKTIDPKIVKIRYINKWEDMESISCIPWQVEVFTLSTGIWRSLYRNLPRKSIIFSQHQQVAVDGFLYWIATDKITMDGGFRSYNLIISFDMESEEFKEVNLPDCLASAAHTDRIVYISKLRNSLAVLEIFKDANNPDVVVWMMENGVPKSFAKLYTINTPYASVLGFNKNGLPILEISEPESNLRLLYVYEPYSKHFEIFVSGTIDCSFFVFPYMETLLLLDQPDLRVYNEVSMRRAKNKRLLKHTS